MKNNVRSSLISRNYIGKITKSQLLLFGLHRSISCSDKHPFRLSAETEEKWTPLKHSSNTPHYLERRSRIRKTVDPSSRRAASQDRSFPSLASWRRKSEPGVIPQYTAKTLPHKITKLKKQKAASKFYTELSDSEQVTESTESLGKTMGEEEGFGSSREMNAEEVDGPPRMDLERIVSDIVNEEFKKLKKGKKGCRDSEPTPAAWMEEKVASKLPAKADSLPRSFQLNDQGGSENYRKQALDRSLKEGAAGSVEDQPAK